MEKKFDKLRRTILAALTRVEIKNCRAQLEPPTNHCSRRYRESEALHGYIGQFNRNNQ
ncbi:MAG: hypothetical protein LBT09_04475 [Planctomycetaceae bacterium]|nr:hypothetical protein [Planctomycetaceae bacterium]